MKLSEIIIRRQIRRILQEAVPTSTAAQGSTGYTALLMTGRSGSGKLSPTQMMAIGALGAIGARILYGIITGPSSPARDAKTQMKAVICGDSQGKGPLGLEVGNILSAKGYRVSNVSVDGAGPAAVLEQVKSNADNAILIVAIFGGNTTSMDAPAKAVVEMYDLCEKAGTSFMAIGPPPVTKITEAAMVQKYGNGDADYWLNLAENDTHSPVGRKEISDKMEAAKSSSGDAIKVYGVASHWTAGSGGNYPDQPDGLHCRVDADKVAQAAMNALGIDSVTAQLKKDIETKSGVSFDPAVVGKASHPDASTPANFDIERYKRGIAKVESNSGYDAESKSSSAKGKYQFLASLHTPSLLEFMKQDSKYSSLASRYATATNAGYKKGDRTSVDLWKAFLKNPSLQEDFMSWIVPNKFAPIARPFYDKSRNDPNDVLSNFDYAQINALYHLAGVDGPKEVRASGLESRPNEDNLTYGEYLSTFNKGYEYDK